MESGRGLGGSWACGALLLTSFLAALAPALPDGRAEREAKARREELERELRSSRPDDRRRAVAGLAELGTREAWEQVLTALEDAEPEVADEAQVQLGRLAEPRALEALLGRGGLAAGDDWVRLRAAEALGRVAIPVDGPALARALATRDADVQRAALWSLERLARRGGLAGDRDRAVRRVVACLGGSRPAGVRASALSTLAVLDPERAAREVREALGDREAQVRCAALAVARGLDEAAGRAAARRLAGDPAPSVRAQALLELEAQGDRAALEVLVERLDVEPRSRLRHDLVAVLQRMSGRKHRDDPRPWRLWLSTLEEGWTTSASTPVATVEASAGGTVAFAGLPILSDRFCVLVDFSGSLWMEREGGRTRKEVLDVEVRKLLEALPEDTLFNVVPYTYEPIPWEGSLRPTRRAFVQDAARFFERCSATGKGNVWDAARLALADPDVDTLVILTDGAPTGGHRWNLDLLVELFVEEVRYRHVAVDSILVDASPGLQQRWSALAERTGGRSIAVEL